MSATRHVLDLRPLRAYPWQALLEAVVLAVLCWLLLFLSHTRLAFIWSILLSLLAGPVALFWYVARLRLVVGSWRDQMRADLPLAVLLALALSALEWCFALELVRLYPLAGPLWQGIRRPLLAGLIAFIMNLVLCGFARLGISFFIFGRQLRRTRLFWSLTYAQVMAVAVGFGVLVVVLEAIVVYNSLDSFTSVFTALGLILLGLLMLLAVVLPFALVSYLVMRQITRRLQTLAVATGALRGGEYGRRVQVVGEDEVALLQTDFNAMAAELERAVQALQKERDTVGALLQERRELVATVSHELRTPMATLRSYLESTLLHWDERDQAQVRNDLRIMEDEVVHLQRMVDELFDLARVEVGKLTLQLVSTSVSALVVHVVAVVTPLAWQMRRIEVVSEIAPDLPPALVDAGRLEQALQNILHNAVRHTPPGGIVAVAVEAENTSLSIRVSDTGEGIAPEKLSRIWERFYQGEQHMQESGAGLGLALVKEWIEGMGGSVAVESVVGQGSCFTLRVPCADSCPAG